MSVDELSSLRFFVAQLVRIWTALSLIRRDRSPELVRVFQDLCSDKLRIMLYEFANKKSWKLGFSPDGNPKYELLFARLREANNWFEGYTNKLHARNCSGAHMMSLEHADHMFQQFGYGGEREWKQLTKGVAACLAMMRLVDGNPRALFWRKIRSKVRRTVDESVSMNVDATPVMLDMPIGVEALLQSLKWN